ncbi:PH domain-containing protein [Micromonospora sp. CPCC 206061]|uniref:PH domain-containing protein n=1 Tax=Micromonospora sp. CPCC 206061 TaxID=3122410 RepID=UPI002FF35B1F
MSSPTIVRFRPHGAIAVAALVALIGAVPVASVSWYLAPVLLIPIAVVVWAWRAGTDATPAGIRVRALLGDRQIPWSDIRELGGDSRGRALARLTNGQVVPLTAVRVGDLPRLTEASKPAQ